MSDPLAVPDHMGHVSILADAQKRLTEQLASLPTDRQGAVVVVGTNEGIKSAIVLRHEAGPNEWRFEAWVQKEWKGGVDYGATVLWTFR